MNRQCGAPGDVNPFSARFVRPGQMPFIAPEGEGVDRLLQRLENCGWRGQIVGAHGSGKSALVASLVSKLEARGRRALVVTLHDGQRRLPIGGAELAALAPQTLVVIDGYEQLAWPARWWIKRRCAQHELALLVTSHRSAGLPEIHRTRSSVELAQRIVDDLLQHSPVSIAPSEVEEAFGRHGGNLREMLFELYDLYEARARSRADGP